jgi:hypothetical protein
VQAPTSRTIYLTSVDFYLVVVVAPRGRWNQFGIIAGQHLRLRPMSAKLQLAGAAW